MDEKIDQKIKNILKDLGEAHSHSEKYYGKELKPGEQVKPVDFFDLALAFDNENRILMDFELALSEKFPQHYTKQQIEHYKKERIRLTNNVRAWQNRQMPKKNRE